MQNILQTVYHSNKKIHKNPHFHDCHQIILVLKGQVEFCVNNKAITANAGDVALFSRYENHSVNTQTEDYERYVLQLDPNIVNRKSPVYSLLTDRPLGFSNIINVLDHFAEIEDIFKKLLLEHNNSLRLSDEMEQLLIKQLLITIYRCTAVNIDNTYDDIAISVKRQFENEYNKAYSLNMLAKQYNVSVSSLSHRFGAATGVSVMEYLQFCRLANAKQMLVETDNSIVEITLKCGFSDHSNFSRIFKKINGISPSAFRKKYKHG